MDFLWGPLVHERRVSFRSAPRGADLRKRYDAW